jgi:hypothetical protein
MRFEARWCWQGYFDLSSPGRRETTTQAIRDELTQRLGQGAQKLQIAQYPVGPQFKHTFWWREGDRDYAEAQFFARVSGDHPILSLGVSIEKGLEDLSGIAATRQGAYRMDRKSWDWPKLLKRAGQLLTEDVRTSAKKCDRPVCIRIVSHQPSLDEVRRHSRTFVLFQDRWFERHVGTSDTKKVTAYLGEVDKRRDSWVVVYIGCELSPTEVEGMEPAQVADALMCFANVRERLHK